MALVSKGYSFVNGTTADATQVNQDLDTLYTLVNGLIDSANLNTNAVATANIQTEAVTPTKTEGIPYAVDVFGNSFVFSGLTVTKDGTNLNQVNVTAGVVYIKQTSGDIRRFVVPATNYRTASASATYYLDFNPDGTWSWTTGHSIQTGYLNVATVTSDGSSNVNVVTQNNASYNVTLMNGATGTTLLPYDLKLLYVADLLNDYVVSGASPSTSTNLTTTTPAQTAYVLGQRVTSSSDVHTYMASQDTYIDLSNTGTLTYIGVSNGAGAPAITANSIRLAKVVTSSTAVTSVTDLSNRIPKISGNSIAQVLNGGYKIQSGSSSLNVTTAGIQVSGTITFPTAFSSGTTPLVFVTETGESVGTNTYTNLVATGANATQFTPVANSGVAQNIGFNWLAIGI